jgi:hypothetical protein
MAFADVSTEQTSGLKQPGNFATWAALLERRGDDRLPFQVLNPTTGK